jgi:hypothetical protein
MAGAKKASATWPSVVRLNKAEHRRRLERVEKAMAARMPGADVPRSSVLAWVVEQGLAVVERELGLVTTNKRKD